MPFDAPGWDDRYRSSDRLWSAEPNQFVSDALADLPPGRAVDLAAGEGRNAVWLTGLGWEVTAVDFSAVAIDRGRVQSDAVTWVVGDVLTVDLPAQVDLSLISYLQLPKGEMSALVTRAVDALRPGGTFFLIAHDASNLTEGVGGPQEAEVLSTAAEVTDWLGPAMDVREAGRVERVTPAGTAYDVRVLARRH